MIKILNYKNKKYIFYGIEHFSIKNNNKIEKAIKKYRPDIIAIELCKDRYQKFTNSNYFEKLNIEEIIKKGQTTKVLSNFFLTAYQSKIEEILGVKPGNEIINAIYFAKKNNIAISFIDQNIEITFKKIIKNLSFFEKIKLIYKMILFYSDKIIRKNKNKNIKKTEYFKNKKKEITDILNNINEIFPSVSNSLIKERDIYMAYKIFKLKEKNILIFIGENHIEGIKKYLISKDINIEKLNKLNKVKKYKINKIFFITVFFLLIVFLFTIFFMKKNIIFDLNDIKYWLFWTCLFGGIGALFAGGHPLTILAAIIGSPIGIILPFITSGMISGWVEAKINKPKFNDFKLLSKDIFILKKWWKNKILKIFIVLFLTSFGTIIGNLIGMKNIIDKFLKIF